MSRVLPKTKTGSKGIRPEDYAYSVMWSEEDGGFVARVAEFASLAAHGSTQEKALREIRKVVEFVIEDIRGAGEQLPEPLSKRRFSGKLNLRMPAHLHRQLSMEAEREGISLNQWINSKLSRNLALER